MYLTYHDIYGQGIGTGRELYDTLDIPQYPYFLGRPWRNPRSTRMVCHCATWRGAFGDSYVPQVTSL
jgi:hypothetical protein